MDILVGIANAQQQAWCDALRVHLPEARLHVGTAAPACDYAVLWRPSAALFDRQPRLKAVFSLGAGVDGLLATPGLPATVPVVRMEDAGMAAQMAEYALYVALREFRGFRAYAQDAALARWAPRPARRRADYAIGVLGLGTLGGAVARALADFGFSVSGWSRTPRAVPGVRCAAGEEALSGVIASSQLLVLCLPATAGTTGLIDRARLASLPWGAVLANIARGELVDERALLEALDSGQLAAAYLDVFATEPLPADHAFWRHPAVEVTPHVAALTEVDGACAQIAGKIRRLEAGLPVTGTVDRVRGY